MNTIKRFITYGKAESRKYNENMLGGLSGFFNKGMRWSDYKKKLMNYGGECKGWLGNYVEEIEHLREMIIKNKIKCSGEEHQQGERAVALWKDRTVSTYSMRGWGDLMAAIWSTEENVDYSFMDFYMKGWK